MSIPDNIAAIRKQIDALDDKLLELLSQRAQQAVKMKEAKGSTPIYSPGREAQIIQRMQDKNSSELSDTAIRAIFSEIIGASRNLERPLRVSYLGPEGTYSHEAAQAMLGTTTEFIPQLALPEVVRAAEAGTTDIAFLPIENSTEGAVTQTHRLLLGTRLQISGEFTLPIRHCLLSNSSDLKDIQTVHGHPQALGQCREWLQINLPHAKLVSESSNSQAAAVAARNKNTAAIASEHASSFIDIRVMVKGINDFSDNQTRFIALSNYRPLPTGNDKTSMVCTVGDKVGALHELLGILADHKVSLTRLESQPQSDHVYAFYIDFDGHHDTPAVSRALKELSKEAKTCKILGSYPKGN